MIRRVLSWWLGIHLFAVAFVLVGLVSWLWMSNRISTQRLSRAAELFQQPVGAVETPAPQFEVEPSQMPVPLPAGKTASPQKASDLYQERRIQELRRVEQYIKNQTQALEQERQKLAAEKKQLQSLQTSLEGQVEDKGFAKAIELYEGLPPRQVKNIFMTMLQEDSGLGRVAGYLAAMDSRKAAAVLEQFRDPRTELPEAKRLMERLRDGEALKESTG
ncbi:MAG: hypothetical protein R3236_00605 [Phycisphaeraceae bacterium]|nr:hypothetical protein [Phycisphaeraceae bacterium]